MKTFEVSLTAREMEEILLVIDQSDRRNKILDNVTMKLDLILDEVKYGDDF